MQWVHRVMHRKDLMQASASACVHVVCSAAEIIGVALQNYTVVSRDGQALGSRDSQGNEGSVLVEPQQAGSSCSAPRLTGQSSWSPGLWTKKAPRTWWGLSNALGNVEAQT